MCAEKAPVRMASQLLGRGPGVPMRRAVCAAILGLVSLWAADARATPVTFAFSGEITFVASLDPSNPFPIEPAFGTPFSGTFTFDSNAVDDIPGDPTTGSYISAGAPFGLTLSLGGLDLTYGAVNIGVTDGYSSYGPGGDQYLFGFSGGDTLVSARFTDFGGTLFSNDSLPLTAFPLNGLFTEFLFSDIINDSQVELGGSITSLTTVPEPATLLVVGAGLCGLIRRRQSRAPR